MKKYRVTVNGTVYEVELEELTGSAPVSAPAAPAAAPAPAASAAPAAGDRWPPNSWLGGTALTRPRPSQPKHLRPLPPTPTPSGSCSWSTNFNLSLPSRAF